MSSQGVATTLVYMAYNTSTGAYVTGDVSNHTLKLVKDGTEASPTNSPSEVDATNTPGAYKLALTAAETQFGTVWLGGKSSTANVIIIPITESFEILPTALDASNNVKITAPTNFSLLSIDGSGNAAITSNIKKNQASSGFMFVMTNPNSSPPNAPFAGLTVTGMVSIDGAAFQSLTNSVVEIGQGAYKIALAAADCNGNHLLLMFTATSANTLFLEIVTQP